MTPHPGHGVPIGETLAPLPAPAAALLAAIREGRADEAELLAASGHPNTYTLTKSIAEHLLAALREGPASVLACAPATAASAARARTGTRPMLVSPILASATCPLERRATAATPTIAHAWAVRWNFS